MAKTKLSCSGKELMDAIKSQYSGRDDTVYCNKRQASLLQSSINTAGLSTSSIDGFRILGMRVVVLPVELPIVCQKGDVFPLAKEYKNE